MNEVIARVGEDSRTNGRVHVSKILDRLEQERDELLLAKKDLDIKVTLVEDWKRDELSKVLAKRLRSKEQFAAVNSLEVAYRRRKTPLIQQIQEIEKRLHDIKTRLNRSTPREEVVILQRIEQLLIRLVEKQATVADTGRGHK